MTEDTVGEDPRSRNPADWSKREADFIVREFGSLKDPIPIGYEGNDHGDILYMYVKGQILTREQYLGGMAGPQEPDGTKGAEGTGPQGAEGANGAEGTGPQGAEGANGAEGTGPQEPEGTSGAEGTGPRGAQGTKSVKGVLDVVRDLNAGDVEVERVIRDVVLLKIAGASEVPDDDPRSVPNLLKHIDEELGPGIATPNHVLTVAPNGAQTVMGPCPATEPQEVYGPWKPYPGRCRDEGGAGVKIFIADTGLLENAASDFEWLEGVDGQDDRRSAGGEIKPYDGHGTFVAGVVRCLAPKAEIYVANVFNVAGSTVESHIGKKLNKALAHGAEIIHLTIASPSRNNVPMLALQAWLEQLPAYKGVVCVAAAGNNGNRLPCWPGAFDGVVSVGALATDWCSRAYFSNFGGWVDVYAPGENLVNAFARGTYKCEIPPYKDEERRFFGMAQWSGTSFSTPIVTGLIATRMSRCGESGQEAAAALMAQARAQALPDVGPVLYPRCGDDRCCGRCGGENRCGGGCGHVCGCSGDCNGCGRSGKGRGCGCGCGGSCGCDGDRGGRRYRPTP